MRTAASGLRAGLHVCQVYLMTQLPDNHPVVEGSPPKKLLLWPNAVAGSGDPIDTPTLTLFQPPARVATGAAMIICPGGGYAHHSQFECEPVAQWLVRLGITAVLLRYRLGPRNPHPAPLQDAARAVKTTRALAGALKVDPNRVGIMGFSAGGHLASTLCTHFTEGEKAAADPVDRFSSRPDLAVLVYPVITLKDPHTNVISRKNLLGDEPLPEQVEHLSSETRVSRRTPPTFLFHTMDDGPVPVENSLMYFAALRANSVPGELHLYEKGEHGVGLAEKDGYLGTWPTLAARWLAGRGFGNGG